MFQVCQKMKICFTKKKKKKRKKKKNDIKKKKKKKKEKQKDQEKKKKKFPTAEAKPRPLPTLWVNALSIALRELILRSCVKLIIFDTFAHETLPVDAGWSR